MTHQRFEEVLKDVLDSLPEQFQYALENVAITVEDEPDPTVAGRGDHELLGIYEGVPLDERGASHMGLPDRVVIYRNPILRMCETEKQIAHEIRDTLIHELGHHMGLSDDEMPY